MAALNTAGWRTKVLPRTECELRGECIQDLVAGDSKGMIVVEKSVVGGGKVLTGCEWQEETLSEAFGRQAALRSKKSLEAFAARSREKRRKNLEARRPRWEG